MQMHASSCIHAHTQKYVSVAKPIAKTDLGGLLGSSRKGSRVVVVVFLLEIRFIVKSEENEH